MKNRLICFLAWALLFVFAVGFSHAQVCHTAKTASKDQIAVADKALIEDTDTRRRTAAISLHLPWGVPLPTTTTTHEHLLVQVDYVIDYDDDLRVPVWTAYRLRKEDIEVKRTRNEAFRRDRRLGSQTTAVCEDYEGSGFDRGHMAPSACFPKTLTSMLNTYLLSNMTPQRGELNRKAWRQLEERERAWAKAYSRLWVVTGAIFDRNSDGERDPDAQVEKIKGRVGIPTAYYKIFVRKVGVGNSIDAIAFVLPHIDLKRAGIPADRYFKDHITSIDEIEKVTGLDFFPQLSQAQQMVLEGRRAAGLWQE